MHIYVSIHLYISVCISVGLSVYLSIYLFILRFLSSNMFTGILRTAYNVSCHVLCALKNDTYQLPSITYLLTTYIYISCCFFIFPPTYFAFPCVSASVCHLPACLSRFLSSALLKNVEVQEMSSRKV